MLPYGGPHETRGELLWSNAEEFIEYLDVAAEDMVDRAEHPQAARLRGIQDSNRLERRIEAEALRDAARRLIAAECSAFLEGANFRSEKWKPFRRLAPLLRPNDTVVTFSYDRVIELLRNAQFWVRCAGYLIRHPPRRFAVVDRSTSAEHSRSCCRVLKLHGSVDWQKVLVNGGPSGEVKFLDVPASFTTPARFCAIATPGPSKMSGAFDYQCLWDLASEALRSAGLRRRPRSSGFLRPTLTLAKCLL